MIKKQFLPNSLKIALLCICSGVKAQEINIASGTKLVMDGDIHLVITDASLSNNGALEAQGGTVHFTGTALSASTSIGGSSSTLFNNLCLHKSLNHVTLNTGIGVKGDVEFMSNNLLLNGYDLDLGTTGRLVGENESSYISGDNGGSVKVQADLNAPASANPGNLGFIITSPANLGLTTISRSHTQSLIGSGNQSFKRSFDVSPGNNSGLNATVQIKYLDNELAGLNESDLLLWTSGDNGVSWTQLGKDQQNTSSNIIEKSGLNTLARFTGGADGSVLTVNWKSFTAEAQDNRVLLKWLTASEQNNKHFEVLRSADGINFEIVTVIPGSGNTNSERSYSAFDNFPLQGLAYYKIRQVDYNGSSTFSKVRSVRSLSKSFVKAYPNPLKSDLTLLFTSQESGITSIKLYNTAGILMASRTANLQAGVNQVEWPLAHIPGGAYFIRFDKAGIAPVKIIKD